MPRGVFACSHHINRSKFKQASMPSCGISNKQKYPSLLMFLITFISRRGWKSEISSGSKKIAALCKTYTKLNKKQNDLCVKYPDLMEPIFRGAKTGVNECEKQLSTNRWNCSNVPAHGTLFGPILPVGKLNH